MKLAAIYNVWDGIELLRGSIDRIKDHVDVIIIVYQNISNFGEPYCPLGEIDFTSIINSESRVQPVILTFEKYTPMKFEGFQNETNKRNIGISIARQHECTHFFHIDVDEYYQDFAALKEEYIESMAFGSVCPIFTYFKKPTWRLENLDGYFVPFIHRLLDNTQSGYGFPYKFYCDPTRVINQADVVKLSQPMHHFSWVRNDIERKARNSSAGQHGNKLKGLLDLYNDLDGDVTGITVPDMGNQKLVVVEDIFRIGDILSIKK